MAKEGNYNQTRFHTQHARPGGGGGARGPRVRPGIGAARVRTPLCTSRRSGTPKAGLTQTPRWAPRLSPPAPLLCGCVWGAILQNGAHLAAPRPPKHSLPTAALPLGHSALFQVLCVETSVGGTGRCPHQRLAGRRGPAEGGMGRGGWVRTPGCPARSPCQCLTTLWLSLAGDHRVGIFPKWGAGAAPPAAAAERGGCGVRAAAIPGLTRPGGRGPCPSHDGGGTEGAERPEGCHTPSLTPDRP